MSISSVNHDHLTSREQYINRRRRWQAAKGTYQARVCKGQFDARSVVSVVFFPNISIVYEPHRPCLSLWFTTVIAVIAQSGTKDWAIFLLECCECIDGPALGGGVAAFAKATRIHQPFTVYQPLTMKTLPVR